MVTCEKDKQTKKLILFTDCWTIKQFDYIRAVLLEDTILITCLGLRLTNIPLYTVHEWK